MLSLFLNRETDKCSQKGCWNFKKHSVFVLNRAIFRCWKKFDHARLWSCRQPFLNYEQASCNQQTNAIICNFSQASSKLFILPVCLKFNHFKISYKKLIRQTACLDSCLWGNWREKVTYLRGKCTSLFPDERAGFYEPLWLNLEFQLLFNLNFAYM